MAVGNLSQVSAVAAGDGFSTAVSNGSVWAWGSIPGGGGSVGVGVPSASLLISGYGFISVAAGAQHVVALQNDGGVWAWGLNGEGQLGNGTTSSYIQQNPQYITTPPALGVAAGTAHTLVIVADGGVMSFGANNMGQLGNGALVGSASPVSVLLGAHPVVAVAAGRSHSLALDSAGTVLAWGSNQFGNLGRSLSSMTSSNFPVEVMSGGVVAIAAGREHSVALKSDGTVWCWGSNLQGQLGTGGWAVAPMDQPTMVAGLSDVVAIAAGGSHTVAMRRDGTIVGWGDNALLALGLADTGSSYLPAARPAGYLVDEDSCFGLPACTQAGSCVALPCNGHGTCASGAVCGCNAGFAGQTCERCAPNAGTYPDCGRQPETDGGLHVEDGGTDGGGHSDDAGVDGPDGGDPDAGPEADAGFGGEADAGDGADDGGADPASGKLVAFRAEGCACQSPLHPPLLLLFALWLRRRRR